MTELLQQSFLLLLTAIIAVPVSRRLGLSSVLGYLVAGVLIGPYVLGFVGGGEGEELMHVAEFGVVMMLFLIGLEVDLKRLWRLRGAIFGAGGLQVTMATGVIGGAAYAFGLPWQTSLAFGFILALSSTAIALQTLNEKNQLGSPGGQKAFAVLLFQDIAVIPALALLPLLALPAGTLTGTATDPQPSLEATAPALAHAQEAHDTNDAHAGDDHGESMDHLIAELPVWGQVSVTLAALAALVFLGPLLARRVFQVVAGLQIRELFTAAALLLVIGVSLLMLLLGLSPALGAFLAGVVLAGSEFRHEIEADIEPFKGLLLGLFFIAVGAGMNLSLFLEIPLLILGLALLLTIGKSVLLWPVGKLYRLHPQQNALFSVSLGQGGEFAFVLGAFALMSGVFDPGLSNLLQMSVAVSMALSPFLFLFNDRVLQPRLCVSAEPETPGDAIDESNPIIIAGFGRFGHIVGRLLRAHGVGATVLDNDASHVELLRKLGLKVYFGDATRFDMLESAGAADAKLLVAALDSPQMNLRVIQTAKRYFPHLKILARAHGRQEAYQVLDAQADGVYRETLDTSLRVAGDALRLLGFRALTVERALAAFRDHDERVVREMAGYTGDQQAYIREARARIEELDLLFRSDDRGDPLSGQMAAWDITSLLDDPALTVSEDARARVCGAGDASSAQSMNADSERVERT
ncbi:MAG: cation:proton antiporter [Opitutales bacterium]